MVRTRRSSLGAMLVAIAIVGSVVALRASSVGDAGRRPDATDQALATPDPGDTDLALGVPIGAASTLEPEASALVGPSSTPMDGPATQVKVTSTPKPTPDPTRRPTPAPTPKPAAKPPPAGTGGAPTLPGARDCPIFPASNVWNKTISGRPVASDSATLIASIGLDRGLHMDFGSYAGYGIPYNVVGASTARSQVAFDYSDESDHVGYPIPPSPKIEAGSDGHMLLVDKDACRLYELFAAKKVGGAWEAGSGATWDLRSNALRPAGWTSADAAGLPILPGLVRYDEVAAGRIAHALRFTTNRTRTTYIYPARHQAGSSGSSSLPPMGLRVRLKASYDTSHLSPQARVIAVALQRYGMILADNGSPWYVTGASDSRFDDDVMHELDVITGHDLEVVDTSGFVSGS